MKILIIEDNELNMKLIEAVLQTTECTLIKAIDAESGLDLVRENKPDLILMDIQLPGMDGLSATRIIKGDPDLNAIPIVALSSHAMLGDEDKAKDAGCDGYITKPIDTRTFLQAIGQYLK